VRALAEDDTVIAAIRVLVVDDHPVFRLGLSALVDGFPGIEVVGEAEDAASARRRTSELSPDVVIMDVQLPDASGIEATTAVLADNPTVGILMLTMFGDDDSVHAAIRAGARGYLVKGAGPDEIERAIRAVANGEMILGAPTAHLGRELHRGAARVFPALSEREEEVLDLVARGLDNSAIARRLVVSDKTVRNHVSHVFTKLGVASRAEAVARARDAGLGGS
jgi:DNA-binding NarL/FixJ family response regulator